MDINILKKSINNYIELFNNNASLVALNYEDSMIYHNDKVVISRLSLSKINDTLTANDNARKLTDYNNFTNCSSDLANISNNLNNYNNDLNNIINKIKEASLESYNDLLNKYRVVLSNYSETRNNYYDLVDSYNRMDDKQYYLSRISGCLQKIKVYNESLENILSSGLKRLEK